MRSGGGFVFDLHFLNKDGSMIIKCICSTVLILKSYNMNLVDDVFMSECPQESLDSDSDSSSILDHHLYKREKRKKLAKLLRSRLN